MKRNAVMTLVIAALIMSVTCSVCFSGDLESQALRHLQESVLKSLPVNRSLARIAVLDFKGDNGSVKSAITSVLNEKTNFKVMERDDFDKILAEQGLQLKDIMDDRTRIRHGRLKGVQGLLMGNVYGSQAGFMSYRIKAHVRLVDVEKGEIILSREFNASAVRPLRRYVILGCAALLVLVLLIIALYCTLHSRRRRTADGVRCVDEGHGIIHEFKRVVDRAIAYVSKAKSRMVETGQTREAVQLKEVERNLMGIMKTVSGMSHGGFRADNGDLFRGFEDIERQSEIVYNLSSAQHVDDVGRQIDILRSAVSRADNDLKERLAWHAV